MGPISEQLQWSVLPRMHQPPPKYRLKHLGSSRHRIQTQIVTEYLEVFIQQRIEPK